MDAIVAGVVEIDEESGCVWLSDPHGVRYPVVWPVGTTAQSEPVEITLADGQTVRSGDRVEGGGGYINATHATSYTGLEPFPPACVHVGEAAVFNADSPIDVTPGVGLEAEETLVDRFSTPEVIPLELIAVDTDSNSVVVIDFVTGTVHRYEPEQYDAPQGALDGASGGGGFIHLWSGGTIYSYPGWLESEALVFQPEPLRATPEGESTLQVLPAPDREHTWLVQPGLGNNPTLIELVNLVEVQVARLMTTEIDGPWRPVGATIDGVVLVSEDPEPVTRLVGADGTVVAELEGAALSVGWGGAVILRPDGSLIVTDAHLGNPVDVDKPREGEWALAGGPVVSGPVPPVETGSDRYLVVLGDDPAGDPAGSLLTGGGLVIVDARGVADPIYELALGSNVATWSRDGRWVIVVENSTVTAIPVDGGADVPLGDLVPRSFVVVTAG